MSFMLRGKQLIALVLYANSKLTNCHVYHLIAMTDIDNFCHVSLRALFSGLCIFVHLHTYTISY